MSLSAPPRRQPTASRLKPVQWLPGASEAAIQADCLELLRVGYPDVLVASIPNGGMVMDPRVVAKLKWQGLKPGMPDLILFWRDPESYPFEPSDVGLIEVKSAVGRLSEEQKSVHAWLTDHGHRVAVVRSTDDVVAVLKEWGAPCRLTNT